MATRSAPIVMQCVLAVMLIVMWLLSRWSTVGSDTTFGPRAALLAGAGIAVVIALVVAAALFRRPSSSARGISLSTAASAAVVLIGAIPYAFWLL